MLLIRTTHGFILLNINRLICCYLRLPTFTTTATRTAPFRRIACPKGSTFFPIYNKIRAFFCHPELVEGSRGWNKREPMRIARVKIPERWDVSTAGLRPSARHDSRSIRRFAPAVRSHPGRRTALERFVLRWLRTACVVREGECADRSRCLDCGPAALRST